MSKETNKSILVANIGRHMEEALGVGDNDVIIVLNSDTFIRCIDKEYGMYTIVHIDCISFESTSINVNKSLLSKEVIEFFK